jgi:hypothetical protein
LGSEPSSGRRPVSQVKGAQGDAMHSRCLMVCQATPRPRDAFPRRRAPCHRRFPSPRWGASKGYVFAFHSRTAGPVIHRSVGKGIRGAAPGHGGVAATPHVRWRGGFLPPGPRAGVRQTRCVRLPNLQDLHISARRPVAGKTSAQGTARARRASPTGLG